MASYYGNIQEEELKNKVAEEWFGGFDTTQIIGKIDFSVAVPRHGAELFETEYYLWAEAKQGTSHDIIESFIQLVLTIGRAHTYERHLPPQFLGAFDAEKIAFMPYHEIMDVFTVNDFNWNVTPSNHESKEFKALYKKLSGKLENGIYLYFFEKDEKVLKKFISQNFRVRTGDVRQAQVTINNFTHVYNKWRQVVQPTIDIDWKEAKKNGIIDADFFLADLLSINNATIQDKLKVLLKDNIYRYNYGKGRIGQMFEEVVFNDGQKAHSLFWKRYKRPPRREFWDGIVRRRDLLVPQDIRERKGSFFTPQKWVRLSQEFLTRVLGDDWQENYYIWDCCGGTGNMETGLTNKYNIYVSTLDPADVDVLHTRIAAMNGAVDGSHEGSNLLDSHVFQFDFLNDPFCLDCPEKSKLPASLVEILIDPEKRRKLVIYINPPYGEGDNRKGEGRSGIAISEVHKKYDREMGYAKREMYVQFLTRIYKEIPSCHIGIFSKLKHLQAPKFIEFRNFFKARLKGVFVVPAKTFDNVTGDFPIAFQIWDTALGSKFKAAKADVYSAEGNLLGRRSLYPYDGLKVINDWTRTFIDDSLPSIGTIIGVGNDFQNQRLVRIEKPHRKWNHQYQWQINSHNLIESSIYLAARTVIPGTWINDRDQFLYPNDKWKEDRNFQGNCLVYAIFSNKNNIRSKDGVNGWIPFTEEEVGAKERFKSHFMNDYINGKVEVSPESDNKQGICKEGTLDFGDFLAAAKALALSGPNKPLNFSKESKAVMDAGRELWRYYHKQTDAIPDASLYDIRLYFQGYKTLTSGKIQMNSESNDKEYMRLIAELRGRLKDLANAIEPKVYEYGFLLR